MDELRGHRVLFSSRPIHLVTWLTVATLTLGASGPGAASHWRLPRAPYIGPHCDNAQIRHCQRVGLAVWVPRPERSVSARLEGHLLRLHTRGRGTGSYRKGMFWQIFFRDSHAQAWADASRSTPVSLIVVARDGTSHTARPLVYVSEGYG